MRASSDAPKRGGVIFVDPAATLELLRPFHCTFLVHDGCHTSVRMPTETTITTKNRVEKGFNRADVEI